MKTKVIRKNGKCLRDRFCPECGREHFHSENMCVTCRNMQQKKRKAKLAVSQCQLKKVRNMRVADTAARITIEIDAIKKAGFDYRKITIEQMINAQLAF